MPQMAPINWLSLFIVFTIIFIMFNMMNYYNFFLTNPNLTMKKNIIIDNNNYLTWKW